MRVLAYILILFAAACAYQARFDALEKSEIEGKIVGGWKMDETPESLRGSKAAAQLWTSYEFKADGTAKIDSCSSHTGCDEYSGTWLVNGVVLRVEITERDRPNELYGEYILVSYSASKIGAVSKSGEAIEFRRK